jgi:putative phosphoribosyl transferase
VSFTDCAEAGSRLAGLVASRLRAEGVNLRDVVVLGLPRGGVPVAAEVAAVLGAPLDVLVVRKLGVPFQPELAFGAIGEHGVRVVNDDEVRSLRLAEGDIADVEARESGELARRVRRYRGERPAIGLRGRVALIVDDGVATGSTARAACLVARAQGAARVILAVPVAPHGWTRRLGNVADEFACLETPRDFFAIGQFYDDFSATTDEQVRSCLRRAQATTESKGATPASQPSATQSAADPEVEFRVGDGIKLVGDLVTPAEPGGIVLFAHGSGSSRHSPRNRYVAEMLNRAGLATLLLDLLTEDEERDRANVFDGALLADRLHGATAWAQDWLRGVPVGYFGASTGAAAAVMLRPPRSSPTPTASSKPSRKRSNARGRGSNRPSRRSWRRTRRSLRPGNTHSPSLRLSMDALATRAGHAGSAPGPPNTARALEAVNAPLWTLLSHSAVDREGFSIEGRCDIVEAERDVWKVGPSGAWPAAMRSFRQRSSL